MNVGLLFGSFNPVHIGHLIVAESMLDDSVIEEVWFVISPQSPFKKIDELTDESHRKKMTALALAGNERLRVCDIEFSLPRPSYTIHTLEKLDSLHKDTRFSIIMGTDNLVQFDEWKRYQDILSMADIHIYDRYTNTPVSDKWNSIGNIHFHDMPLLNVSSTRLRNNIRAGKSIKYWVLPEVEKYIKQHGLYIR